MCRRARSESLADAIARVSLDEGLRQSIGRNAMKTVTENYTWLHYGRRVAGYFQEAIEGVGRVEKPAAV